MKSKVKEDFYVKSLVKNPKKNKDLKRILLCIATKYGKIKNGSVQYREVKNLICEECKNNLYVIVTRKQISKLMKIKKQFPYKAIAVLMAMYNLLKREDNYCNVPEIGSLMDYIKQINGNNLLCQELCLERSLSKEIYNAIDKYTNNDAYNRIYELYCKSYVSLDNNLEKISFLKLCECNFRPSEFTAKDIPDGMKKNTERQYLR